MKLAAWLLAMCEPLLARILVSLGFSVVTITGMSAVISQLKAALVTDLNALPVDMLNVLQLAGGGIGLGMIFGAMTTRLMLWTIQSGTKILGVNPT